MHFVVISCLIISYLIGMRIGFATGPKPLIETIQLNQQVSSIHPSGMLIVL